MNDIEHTNKEIYSTGNPPPNEINNRRQAHRTSPSPEAPSTATASGNQLAPLDAHYSVPLANKNNAGNSRTLSPASKANSLAAKPGAGNSNSLPGHQTGRSKINNYQLLEQQALNLSDNLHSSGTPGDQDTNPFTPSSLSRKKNLSTSDLDPIERKKQAALAKVETKLEKAKLLHQKAHVSVEQEISDFLRQTAMPNVNNEVNTSRTTNASFDKRIKTLQDTKKELEKKIAAYQSDIARIQSGDIPHNYTSSKDIFSNIKSTAAKVAGGSLKHRPTQLHDQTITITAPNTPEQTISSQFFELDSHHHHHHANPLATPTTPTPASVSTSGAVNNNNQSSITQALHSSIFEPTHPILSTTISNEVGNSQFYIDSTLDGSTMYDIDKSPTTKRRLTDDSLTDYTDRTSDHSGDDRHINNTSKRNTSTTTASEYQQLNTKIDSMQKSFERYETKINDMQKQIDSLNAINDTQREQNERLNTELTDLIDLHQVEMSSMKTDLKNLEERLAYKFNDYWNEVLEKLDKLDTRTAKVEQTQTHSLETEENTHRIISKLVNIVLTVFAIILLLLSTLKNLVQSRVHAMTLLILAIIWITFHYLPPNYFQTSFLKNFPNVFKRTS
ncbi:unnamed protein product [Adineta steineri]|uniref:Uncharacterized protein n=1 Tax=Adineta steineri TaxID=433720 RepID=A0A814H335_9BILA|nr:unnamed protein product [Adineta steineri]